MHLALNHELLPEDNRGRCVDGSACLCAMFRIRKVRLSILFASLLAPCAGTGLLRGCQLGIFLGGRYLISKGVLPGRAQRCAVLGGLDIHDGAQ